MFQKTRTTTPGSRRSMLQGTNFVNFMGRYVYVAATDALEAVAVTEHAEPQAVYGSNLHRLAYKNNFEKFVNDGRELKRILREQGPARSLSGAGARRICVRRGG